MLAYFYLGSFSYTSRSAFIFLCGVSLAYPVFASFLSYICHAGFIFIWRVSLTHPMLAFFFFLFSLSLSHLGGFSYTSRAAIFFFFFFLFFFLSGEFFLHIPCCPYFYLGSFSYTSYAVLSFTQGVCVTHPVLAFFYFFTWDKTTKKPFSYTFRAGFFFLFFSFFFLFLKIILLGEFLSPIPCWPFFSFFFTWGVSLTHSVLTSFLFGQFLLHIPCWIIF